MRFVHPQWLLRYKFADDTSTITKTRIIIIRRHSHQLPFIQPFFTDWLIIMIERSRTHTHTRRRRRRCCCCRRRRLLLRPSPPSLKRRLRGAASSANHIAPFHSQCNQMAMSAATQWRQFGVAQNHSITPNGFFILDSTWKILKLLEPPRTLQHLSDVLLEFPVILQIR